MDRDSVWSILHGHIQPPKGQDLTLEIEDWKAGLGTAATAIAEAHEQDKNDALEVQDTAWHEIEGKWLDELAQLRSKVAVLAEAAETAKELLTDLLQDEPMHPSTVETSKGVLEAIDQALEDAPEVLFSDKGHIQYIEPHEHCDGQGETRVSFWAGYIRLGPGKMYEEGREVDVCACLPSGEQQQNGEQEGSGE